MQLMICYLRSLIGQCRGIRHLPVLALLCWGVVSCRAEQPLEWSSAVSVVVAEWGEPNRSASLKLRMGALAVGLPWESSGPPQRPVQSRLWVFEPTPQERLDWYDIEGGVFQQSIARYGATADTLLCAVLSREGDVFLGRRSGRAVRSWDVKTSIGALIRYPSLDLANLLFARSSRGVAVVGPCRERPGQLTAMFLSPKGNPIEWSSGPISGLQPSGICLVEGGDEVVAIVRLFGTDSSPRDWILNASGESRYSPVHKMVDGISEFPGLRLGDAIQTFTGIAVLEFAHRDKSVTSYRVRDLENDTLIAPAQWMGGNLHPMKLVLSDHPTPEVAGVFAIEIAPGSDREATSGIFISTTGFRKLQHEFSRVNGPLVADLVGSHSLVVEYVSFDYRAVRVTEDIEDAASPPAKPAHEVPRSGGG